MSTFERCLTLWVGLCIAVGVALGHLLPAVFLGPDALARLAPSNLEPAIV